MALLVICLLWFLCALVGGSSGREKGSLGGFEGFASTLDGTFKLSQLQVTSQQPTAEPASANVIVEIDETQTFQEIFGIGSSFEASTCWNLMKLSSEERNQVLKQLLDPIEGIGISLMRLTIGTSDFTPPPFYSYDDSTEPDDDLSNFSIDEDRKYIIPAIKEALAYSETKDGLKFFASSWSPPAFMKTSNSLTGGEFNSSYSALYAKYLAMFVEAYNKEGIQVEALTPQNEPLQNDPSYPTTWLTADQEIDIVKHLGPLLPNDTEIWSFDHNWDLVDYAYRVLADPEARKVVAGTAFHLYGGQPSAMTKLKEAYPDKKIFFSEGSEFKVRGAQQMVEIFQNYASTYNAWVTMLDTNMQPNAGPFKPMSTLVELDTLSMTPIYRFEFYMLGQFSKFVRRGAFRIQSSLTFLDSDRDGGDLSDANGDEKGKVNADNLNKDVTAVAFINPQDPSIADEKNRGAIVVVVVNPASTAVPLQVRFQGSLSSVVSLPPGSVSTLRFGGVIR